MARKIALLRMRLEDTAATEVETRPVANKKR